MASSRAGRTQAAPVQGARAVASATAVALLVAFASTGSVTATAAAKPAVTADFASTVEASTQPILASSDVQWDSGETFAAVAEEPAPEPVAVPEPATQTASVAEPAQSQAQVADYVSAPPARMGSVVETAMQYLGYRYVYGTAGPTTFDCSGFTQYVFGLHGISLPRGPAEQGQLGYSVPLSQAQPGDLFIAKDRSHVGIYIGNGLIVHAANPQYNVSVGEIKYFAAYDIRRL